MKIPRSCKKGVEKGGGDFLKMPHEFQTNKLGKLCNQFVTLFLLESNHFWSASRTSFRLSCNLIFVPSLKYLNPYLKLKTRLCFTFSLGDVNGHFWNFFAPFCRLLALFCVIFSFFYKYFTKKVIFIES